MATERKFSRMICFGFFFLNFTLDFGVPDDLIYTNAYCSYYYYHV